MKNISVLSIECNDIHRPMLMMINKWTIEKNYNTSLFTSKYDAVLPNQSFSVLPIHESKYVKDTMLVWDTLSLQLCIDFPNLKKIIYLQNNNIPWMNHPNISYDTWSRMFDNPKIQIISPYEEVVNIFKLTWNKGTLVVSLDSEQIYEHI